MMTPKYKNCLICSGENRFFILTSEFKIYKCNNCGLGYTKNLSAQNKSYHRDENYLAEEDLFKNIFQKRIKIIKRFLHKGAVLEIGCSTGLMLFLLQEEGFKVMGVEPSKSSAKAAQEKGIKVLNNFFEKVKLRSKFDLILLNHTLEHLNNPVEVIGKLAQLNSKNGFLYIDLPNFNSLSLKLLKGNWPHLLPKEHLWHFTDKSLSLLLSKFGYKIVYVEKSSGIWDLNNPTKEIFTAFFNMKKRLFNELITALPSLIVSRLSMGSDLMVIAKKVE